MRLKAIQTEQEYDVAIARISKLMNAEPGTPEAEELDALADVLVAYEEEHFPISPPDPVTAIQFRIEQQGMS